MARSVDEINYGALTYPGNTFAFPRTELTVQIKWTRNDGTKDTQVRTPNGLAYVMARMPKNIIEERITQLVIECLRVQLGVDEGWPEGSSTVTIEGNPVP